MGGPGFIYEPTVLDRATPDMAAFREETFGLVAAVTRAKDANSAVRLANDTGLGLGASPWTADTAHVRTLARRIDAGAMFINGMVASDPRLAFGGIEKADHGRELSELGIEEFVNSKTLWIGHEG